ncbi:aldose 1-epimerase [Pricia antarctica]|uniref:Aldose 1-epimerase n=1 Tax=Pricia antarctica TaxID=641691 RepID=A0A1G6XXF5_9FLAO|nr:aldose epimerase family protein [Pricia antarctica]SDD82868.1 aldose 1-epimerase [Pricia antarctica]
MQDTDTITIRNRNGLTAKFLSLGARWTEMYVPNRNGVFEDILLGFPDKKEYLRAAEKYYGAVVGRYCGRIPNGRFTDGDTRIELPLNDSGKHHLHGGKDGFHLKEWKPIPESTSENTVGFSLFSEDGEEGYPGNLEVRVIYTLTNDDQLIFEATASTDQRTLVNLTNHAFFNLTGRAIDLGGHELWVNGDLLARDREFLTTGEIIALKKPFQVPLKDKISSAFRLKHTEGHPDLTLSEPGSGRSIRVYTDQVVVQLYNGFFMTGSDVGKNDDVHYANTGLAIEPQYLVHRKLNLVYPGETYKHRTIYEFGVDKENET